MRPAYDPDGDESKVAGAAGAVLLEALGVADPTPAQDAAARLVGFWMIDTYATRKALGG